MLDTTAPPPALTRALAELGALRLDEHPPESVLERVAALARDTVPGASEVSVTALGPGGPTTPTATGPVAQAMDTAQYERGTGPCLDAATGGTSLLVPDATNETRWPGYAEAAAAHGVRSSLSTSIALPETTGAALNTYSTEPAALDESSQQLAETFASYASVVLANAHLYASTRRLAEQLDTALQTRAVIEQAKGILMAQESCSADAAFDLLVKASQRSNTKLHDVARRLVEGAARRREPDDVDQAARQT